MCELVQEFISLKLVGLLGHSYCTHTQRSKVFSSQFDPLHTPHLINHPSDLREKISAPFYSVFHATHTHTHTLTHTYKAWLHLDHNYQ